MHQCLNDAKISCHHGVPVKSSSTYCSDEYLLNEHVFFLTWQEGYASTAESSRGRIALQGLDDPTCVQENQNRGKSAH